MYKTSINWFKGKWIIIKQTCRQLFNLLCNRKITPRGEAAYDYYCKVIFKDYEPQSYAEMTYEFDLKTRINNSSSDLDRKEAAIQYATLLADHIAPWDFWKKEYKIFRY